MIGRNGDTVEQDGHDRPTDTPDNQDSTRMTAAPDNGRRPSSTPSAEEVTRAWQAEHREKRKRRGAACANNQVSDARELEGKECEK